MQGSLVAKSTKARSHSHLPTFFTSNPINLQNVPETPTNLCKENKERLDEIPECLNINGS